MPSGNDWLMRPVLRGMVQYIELHRTNLDLNDWAEMNEAIDVEQENQRRLNAAHGSG